jgi:hypothetical protein
MKRPAAAIFLTLTLSVLALTFVGPQRALAHCDGMDGPVVKAAQRALAKGDVNLVLIWVQANDEAEIRKVFAKTMAVRRLNAEARELAERRHERIASSLDRLSHSRIVRGIK